VETVAVELGDLFVEPDRIEIPSGSHLQVDVTNGGDLVHDLTLEGETGTDRLESGETQTADFGVIDADTQAWCTVPGHKEAGMLLDIVVTEPVPDTTTTTAPAGA
jgi:nitrite reductase (NO-forming)